MRHKQYARLEDQPAVMDEPRDHAVDLRVVGLGEPRNSEAVDDIEQRDRDFDIPSVTENRETQGSKTTPWQSIPEKVPRSQQTKLW